MIIDPSITHYLQQHSDPEPALLAKIAAETEAEVPMAQMLCGHIQGRFLALVSRLLQPLQIVEVGTFTGYSALCLLEGLQSGGSLTTIDHNAQLEDRVRGYFAESGHEQAIDYRIDQAEHCIPSLAGPFDLVYLDADKKNYGLYYDLLIDKMRPGGCILVDNVLWKGLITQPDPDEITQYIVNFNKKISSDPRVDKLIIPLRDGILMIQKKIERRSV